MIDEKSMEIMKRQVRTMKINQDDSPAMQLMKTVWNHATRATGHSWRRYNGALSDALELAITGGFDFHEDDLACISKEMGGAHWMGNTDSHTGEQFYSEACKSGNSKAWQAFEKWYDRKPFILDGQRLYVGLQFLWRGERLTVTSFAGDHSYVVACKHKRWQDDSGSCHKKVLSVKKISHQDIYAWNRERREWEAALEQMQPAGTAAGAG